MTCFSNCLWQLMNLRLRLKVVDTRKKTYSHLLHWSLSLKPTSGNLDKGDGSCEIPLGFHKTTAF